MQFSTSMAYLVTLHPCLLFVLFHRIVLITSSCIEAPEGIFQIQPTTQIVHQGDDAFFTCSVTNFVPDVDYVTWEVVRDVNRKEVVDRFDRITRVLNSSIIVRNVLDESQLFRCELRRGVPNGSPEDRQDVCYLSNRARTIVQNFPTQTEVTCQPKNPMPVEIGETIAMSCSAPRSKPPVDMGFILDKPSYVSIPHPIATENGPIRTITQDITVTSDLHLRTINCRVTSEMSFPGRVIVCPIGPLKVYQWPIINVEPPKSVLQSAGEFITLSCRAIGFPDVFTYSWCCFPQGYLEGCVTRTKEVSLSFNCSMTVHPSPIEVVIQCSAMNSRGASSKKSRLLILSSVGNDCKHHTTTAETLKEPKSDSGNIMLVQRYAEYMGNSKWSVAVDCSSVSIIKDTSVDLSVYFDGKLVNPEPEQNTTALTNTYKFSINNVSSLDMYFTVSCEAETSLGLYENSINVSLDLSLMDMTGSTVGGVGPSVTGPTYVANNSHWSGRNPTTKTGNQRGRLNDAVTKQTKIVNRYNQSITSTKSYPHVPYFMNHVSDTELKVIMLIVGVILAVCMIPCVVGGISVALCRYFIRGPSKTSRSSNCDTNEEGNTGQMLDVEGISIEPPYEVPISRSTFDKTDKSQAILPHECQRDHSQDETSSSSSDTWSSNSGSSSGVSHEDSSSC